jgi:hypothetical protein
MTIEDLITVLALGYRFPLNKWDSQLVYSFADQIGQGRGFTEKQATLALKILKRHYMDLSNHLKINIEQFLENPTYRYEFRQLNSTKKIDIVSDPQWGRVAKVQFPYNEDYVGQIRKSRDELNHAVWDKDEKSWIFSVTEANIQFLMNLAEKENFHVDEEFKKYVNQSKEILQNIDLHVPMLMVKDNRLKFVNISKNIPE